MKRYQKKEKYKKKKILLTHWVRTNSGVWNTIMRFELAFPTASTNYS